MASIVPTIDISPYILDSGSPAAKRVVLEIQRACTTVGFFQIIGHGISEHLRQSAFDAAQQFFQLPLDIKRTLDRATVPGAAIRGYELLRSQKQEKGKVGDCKEGFYIGFDIPAGHPCINAHPEIQGPNLWPPPEVLPYSVFKDPMEKYHSSMIQLYRHLFSIISDTLPDVPVSVFEDFQADFPIALLSPKHYPPTTDEDCFGTDEHTDFGFLTLLLQDGTPGLQIKHEGTWFPVVPNKDAYICNIGDLAQSLTRGQYKSTVHRVVAQRGTTHRYSIPFFFNGNPDFRLEPFSGAYEGEEICTVEEHLVRKLKKTMVKV